MPEPDASGGTKTAGDGEGVRSGLDLEASDVGVEDGAGVDVGVRVGDVAGEVEVELGMGIGEVEAGAGGVGTGAGEDGAPGSGELGAAEGVRVGS